MSLACSQFLVSTEIFKIFTSEPLLSASSRPFYWILFKEANLYHAVADRVIKRSMLLFVCCFSC